MWRGLIRGIARGLRHGLVVAGVCVGIAVVTGVSGYVFGERPTAAHGQTALPAREGATTSLEVLNRWLRPLAEGEPAGASAGSPAAAALTGEAESFDAAMAVTATAPDGGEALLVRAHRTQVTTPRLAPGDRPLVTVSFYYCEESPGGYARGDGGGFCGRARDGSFVRSGVAACDIAYLGQRFRIGGDPTGRVYVCADTGSAVQGMHRDVWFLDNRTGWGWQSQVGVTAVIEVLP